MTCSRCDYTTYDEIAALGHSFGDEQTEAATCETDGCIYHVCDDCGYKEVVLTIKAKGHTESEWIVDTPAGNGVTGKRHKECTDCGERLAEEDIPAISLFITGCGGTIHGVSLGVIGLLGAAWLVFAYKRKEN